MAFDSLALPALRGTMGDWIYYSCLMPVEEIAERVSYAKVVHPDKALSRLIQRSLEGKRAEQISQYLATTEHFMNALVLATYGGSPNWLEVGNFRTSAKEDVLDLVPEDSRDALGFLRLSGSEKIFAIDGQHRLAGIRQALEDKRDLSGEQIPVILVGHQKDQAGLQRTRRLFTTLNKTAVPVRKQDIISLDEDDVMAITARRLVETNKAFRDPKIAVVASQAIPAGNRTCLTTISSLYDTLRLIFKHESGGIPDRELKFNRPSDGELDRYYSAATAFFDAVAQAFPPVGKLMNSSNPSSVTPSFRRPDGGHVLFRPIGLDIVTQVSIRLADARDVELPDAVRLLKNIPTELTDTPYAGVIWNVSRESINTKGKALARDLLLHMCSLPVGRKTLARDYSQALGTSGSALESLTAVAID